MKYELKAETVASAGLGYGSAITVQPTGELWVFLRLSALSGTGTTFDAWLQAQDPLSGEWFDMPYDRQIVASSGAADISVAVDRRNIAGGARAAGLFLAIYKNLPTDQVRLAFFPSSGATATFTAQALSR